MKITILVAYLCIKYLNHLECALLNISMPDWIQMATQLVLAITAVVMARLTYLSYLKIPTEDNSASGQYLSPTTNEITVFETSEQRTKITLETNDKHIKCYLLDKKKDTDTWKWTIDQKTAKDILRSSNIYVNPSYKPRTGTFTIGNSKNWLYSKNLYPEPDFLKVEIETLLKKLTEIQ